MHHPHTLRLSTWARLIVLSLLLVCGLLAGSLLTSNKAHAQTASTVTITDCSDDSQLQSAVRGAASGETIAFGCSGDIHLSQTLSIAAVNLTLDGSGQRVTLDGSNNSSGPVLFVYSGLSLTLNALTIANSPYYGGLNNDGTVSISNSTFANNRDVQDYGGGLFNYYGTVSISNSTFSGNFGRWGGGLANEGGTVSISNSTFANNSSLDGGGGLANNGTVSISNSTFANNSRGGGILNDLFGYGGTVSVSNSIVAGNVPYDCYGGVSDQGYNLEGWTYCGFTGTGDLQKTDPKLASLASNGGATQTLALLDGSPAINHIPSSACALSTDQRGVSRPQGPACDIGAFEFQAPKLSLPSSPLTVDATSPQGASVTYTAKASEPDDASATPAVSCSSASGSTFAIGTTTVNCSASDAANPPDVTKGSFQVVVKGAATQVSDLITTVNSFQLANSLQTSLDNKLQDVLTAVNSGQTATACSELTDFIGHVQSQSGKGLTTSRANQLIAAARQVQAVLRC